MTNTSRHNELKSNMWWSGLITGERGRKSSLKFCLEWFLSACFPVAWTRTNSQLPVRLMWWMDQKVSHNDNCCCRWYRWLEIGIFHSLNFRHLSFLRSIWLNISCTSRVRWSLQWATPLILQINRRQINEACTVCCDVLLTYFFQLEDAHQMQFV